MLDEAGPGRALDIQLDSFRISQEAYAGSGTARMTINIREAFLDDSEDRHFNVMGDAWSASARLSQKAVPLGVLGDVAALVHNSQVK